MQDATIDVLADYFGFTEKPFKPTPEPRFLFPTPQHEEALAAILYTIRERMGFVAVVGEPGTGKTTLLRTAINQLDKKTRLPSFSTRSSASKRSSLGAG